MSRRARRVLFYFFVLVFFLVAPNILLYAYGYKYDFEKKKFTETGALYVKSLPKKSNIVINGKESDRPTPFLIKGLLPHRYSLRVETGGAVPWTKELEVYPGLVTKAESVLLFPETPLATLLNEQKITNFSISPDKERILYVVESQIWVQELEKNSAAIQLTQHEFANPSPEAAEYKNIQWANNSKYFIYQLNNEWFFVDIQKPNTPINFSSILGTEINNLKWSGRDSENIYFVRNQQLFRFEWRSKNSGLLIENLEDYHPYNGVIYFTREPNRFLYQSDFNGGNQQQVTFGNPDNFKLAKIQVSPSGILIITDTDNNAYTIESSTLKPLASGVKNTEFSPDSKKLLIQTDHEIFVRYLDDIEGAPNRKKGEQILIARYSDQIKKAAFLPVNYEYIIFEVGSTIKISETDNRDRLNVTDLAKGNNFETLFKSETFGSGILNVYYTNEKGLNLVEVEL